MSALGTRPTAAEGRLVTISIAQFCLYPDGRGIKAECREEEGGSRCGAAYCSKFTAHSVAKNAGGFFFRATSAHVGAVVMVFFKDYISLFIIGVWVYWISSVSKNVAQYVST